MTYAMAGITVRQILHPRSVAVVGASEDVRKFGGRVMHYLVKHGFEGRILPINPARRDVFGRPCYPRMTAAPGPIDVALLAIPPQAVAGGVAECAEAGVGCCVVMTTGFAEEGPEGAARQEALTGIVGRSSMRLIGPNCMGLINPYHHLALTSSLVLEVGSLLSGAIGLISQSGALMVSMYNRAHDAGIGFSACVSLGNQADLEICDILEYMVDDPLTKAICVYVEGFRNARRFLELAAACRERRKPLLAVKVGRTDAGVRAARSHTASLAGSYAVFEAACRDLGVLVTDDPDGMIQAADVLARWGRTGGGVGVLSPSGGGAAVAADRLTDAGVRLTALQAATKERLRAFLQMPQADNPIDLGGRQGSDPVTAAEQAMDALAGDPGVGAIFVPLTTVPFYEETTRALATAAVCSGKPVLIAVTPGSAADGPRRILRELGCAYYDRLDEAFRVAALWAAYQEHASRPLPGPTVRPSFPADPRAVLRRLPSDDLTGPQMREALQAYGIPVARERLAAQVAEAIEGAESIGYPVALKAVCRGLVHKSDAGVVHLGLADGAAVARAWHEIAATASRLSDVEFKGCVVQEMVTGGAEIIVGAKWDAQFGPVVLVGWGGVLVEVLQDVQMALAPITPAQAAALLEALKVWPILRGVRGRPPLDVDALAEVASRVSWLAADLGDRLVELDVNPLLVRARGEGVVAVDCRATLSP